MLWLLCNSDINQPRSILMLWNCIIPGWAPQGNLGHFYTLFGSLWTFSNGLCFSSESFGPPIQVLLSFFQHKPTELVNQSQIFTFNRKSFPSQKSLGKSLVGNGEGSGGRKDGCLVFFFFPHSLGCSLHLTSYTTVKAGVNCSAALTMNKGCLTLSDLLVEL